MSLVQFPRLSRREEQEFTGSISGTEWERGAGACRFDSRHQTNTFFSLSPSHRSPSALFFFLPGLPTTLRGLCRERFTTIVERWLSISLFSISELQSSFWLSYVSHLVKPSRHAKRMIAVKRHDIKNLTILVAVRGVTTSQAKFRYATKVWKQDGTDLPALSVAKCLPQKSTKIVVEPCIQYGWKPLLAHIRVLPPRLLRWQSWHASTSMKEMAVASIPST